MSKLETNADKCPAQEACDALGGSKGQNKLCSVVTKCTDQHSRGVNWSGLSTNEVNLIAVRQS